MFNFKWYNKWVEDNPTNVFGPAIVIGVVGAGVFAAALIVTWGNPIPTETQQTGPRGTGMGVVEFVSDIEAGEATPEMVAYFSEEPYEVFEDEPLAGDIYENVQVLGNVPDGNFNRLMAAMTEWVSPEQGCAYCHGEEGNFASDEYYPKVVARRMIQMTQSINENWNIHVGEEVGVNCYTCHRGQNVPEGIWFDLTPINEVVEGWAAVQNRATSLSGSTSLPSDALSVFLADYGVIAVHDLEPRVSGTPGVEVASIQDTERTYSLMNYFSNSLGVNCTFCHNTNAFYDYDQVTPQHGTAQLGIAMVQELNLDYLIPLADVYPAERLGPVHADAPKAACRTCHLGQQQPLGGMDMVSDWPELASSEAPVYE
ncbi:photosynthetic reaction center cytochrome PufC [Pontivivens insulae]|uniref:Photosynthetic reaction center cytochrome c subunit n=1 Tax=Pontivivens insulae TaxID=1639689 RepID=A0A2R8AAD0_9RHOB|nr:photosynthetic reaction center cytochrome PufC [Pontivivens insulae]RED12917.1 photosynthetic reaction center cytochrome c subunit [Pontivivens insulae]SPF29010.1 Photosynthetic reaction center cytochrome c subunit [Pontivivens insulae]